MHDAQHPLARQTVTLTITLPPGSPKNLVDAPGIRELQGQEFRIEDWQDRVFEESWQTADGNPTAIKYAVRSGVLGLPLDDECVYGKVNGIGHIVHVSEFEDALK